MKFLIGKAKMMLFLSLSFSKSNRISLESMLNSTDVDSDFNPETVFQKTDGLNIERDFGKFDPNQKYIISITGVTTGGKSSVASFLYKTLSNVPNCRPFVIHQDNYYKDDETMKKESKLYMKKANNPLSSADNIKINYESPGAYKWTELKNHIISLLKNDESSLVISKYSYSTGKLDKKKEEVPKNINILIVEGLYAQNLFDENSLDVSKYDPCDVSEEAISLYETSTEINKDLRVFITDNKIKVLKLFIDLPDHLIRKNRLMVDKMRTNRSEEETKRMLDDFIIPSCNKLIRTFSSKANYVFPTKSRSINNCVCISMIIKYFDERNDVIQTVNTFRNGFKKSEKIGDFKRFVKSFWEFLNQSFKFILKRFKLLSN